MTKTMKRKRCWDVRLARARQARQRARKRRAGWLLMWIVFVLAFFSPAMVLAPKEVRHQGVAASGTMRHESSPTSQSGLLGVGAPLVHRPRMSGRYDNSRPSLARLLRDLRRPAARQDAADMLLSRLPTGEAGLREWVAEQLDDGSLSALALWARPGMGDDEIIATWKGAARRDAAREVPAPTSASTP